MLSYEYFWLDETGEAHIIGMMPERRQDSRRITKESVMQWLRVLLGESIDPDNFFFSQIKIDEDTGAIRRVGRSFLY